MEPDRFTCRALRDAFVAAGQPNRALQLLDAMRAAHLDIDGSLLNGLGAKPTPAAPAAATARPAARTGGAAVSAVPAPVAKPAGGGRGGGRT